MTDQRKSDQEFGSDSASSEVESPQDKAEQIREVRGSVNPSDASTLLHLAFDAAPDCIALKDHLLRYTHVNAAAERLFSIPSSGIIGKTDSELLGEEQGSAIAALEGRVLAGEVLEHDQIFRSSGVTHVCHVVRAPMKDGAGSVIGLCAIARKIGEASGDVTEHKKMEERFRENIARLNALVDAIPDVVFFRDVEGRNLIANKALEELTGMDRQSLFGKTVDKLFPPELAKQIHSSDQEALRAASPVTTQEYFTDEEGKNRYFETIKFPIYDDRDNLLGMGGVSRDITDRKRSEDLLVKTERLTAVADLASGVAHNFNNLLQIAMDGAQLALYELQSGNYDEAKSIMDRILESTRFGADTVKRLQSFGHLGSQIAPGQTTIFDLSDTVRHAADVTAPWWKAGPEREGRSVSFETDLTPHCQVIGNENELFEVLTNLIKNAAEALPEGGHIKVKTRVSGDEVVLQVQDDGIGIAPKNLVKVFDPFWTTKGFKGTGMGLASSFAIVSRHGGEISVTTEEGEGATFSVKLPLAKFSHGIERREDSKAIDFRLRILVIDDLKSVVSMLKNGLTKKGQVVYGALSGKEALEILEKTPIDVIVSDLGMPEMNGWQVGLAIKEMRREKGLPKLPFILLTGWAGQLDELENIADSGVDRLLEKPVLMPQLLDTIREVVRECKPNGESDT